MIPRTPAQAARVAVAAILTIAAALPAEAQAWVPPQGSGAVSVAVQRIDQDGHRLTDGTLARNGQSLNVSVYVDAGYAVTDCVVLGAALPYVFGRYTDAGPPPPFLPFLPIDQCRCWQSGAQDVSATVRYNLLNGAFALTPSIALTVPTHDYAYQGEAAIGRHLKELHLAVDAGRRLDWLSPRLAIEGRYSYSVVERVLDIPNSRSNATVDVSYRLHRRLSVEGLLQWQRTHGGLRIGAPASALLPPGDVNTPELLAEHDRLLRDNSFHLGASVSCQLPNVDVFASYVGFVDGTDTHAGHALTVGVSWPFERRRSSARATGGQFIPAPDKTHPRAR